MLATINLVAQVIYFSNWTFKALLGVIGYCLKDVESPAMEYSQDLPTYTILCPMYREETVVRALVQNLMRLQYPSSKLQILLLLEKDDTITQNYIKKYLDNLPKQFQVVIVPAGGPKTKPNACNYGLSLATGEYLVIFDAEDNPEKDQLLKAVYCFKAHDALGDKNIGAVQARLSYYNEKQNALTRMFTYEYDVWFKYYLPALSALDLAIPLGGTSNHFKTSLLKELGGWRDSNLTEDAELGLRLYAHGYEVEIINSTTWEEAVAKPRAWINQRVRWTQGYIQTSLQYLISGNISLKTLRHKIGSWLFILATPVFNLLYIPINLVYFIGYPELFEGLTGQLARINLFIGIGSLVFIHFLTKKSPWALLIPFYWCLHSVAAFKAVAKQLRGDLSWTKTFHTGVGEIK